MHHGVDFNLRHFLKPTFAVADPGFSPGGAPTPKSAIIFQFFCRKLHENERIWTPRGGARPWRPPLDPPMLCVYVVFTFNELNCFQGLNSKYDRKLPNAYLVNHLIYIVQLVVLFLKFIMFYNDIYLNIYNDYCLWSQYMTNFVLVQKECKTTF